MIIVDCCAETSLESTTDFQSCLTETMFCFLKWFLRSNQQLSSQKMPITSCSIVFFALVTCVFPLNNKSQNSQELSFLLIIIQEPIGTQFNELKICKLIKIVFGVFIFWLRATALQRIYCTCDNAEWNCSNWVPHLKEI